MRPSNEVETTRPVPDNNTTNGPSRERLVTDGGSEKSLVDEEQNQTVHPTGYRDSSGRSAFRWKRYLSALVFALLGVFWGLLAVQHPEFVSRYPTLRFGEQRIQAVFFALSGTGLFISVLILFITPEDAVSARLFEHVYRSYAQMGTQTIGDTQLNTYTYVPQAADGGYPGVRLSVAAHQDDTSLPLSEINAISHETSFSPVGELLFDDFRNQLRGDFASAPNEIAAQLSDALINDWKIAENVVWACEEDGRCTFGIYDPVCEPITQFDHPLVSFLGVGLTKGLGIPVRVKPHDGDDYVDYVVSCTWEESELSSSETERAD